MSATQTALQRHPKSKGFLCEEELKVARNHILSILGTNITFPESYASFAKWKKREFCEGKSHQNSVVQMLQMLSYKNREKVRFQTQADKWQLIFGEATITS